MSTDSSDMYQEMILDYYRHPRNHGTLPHPDIVSRIEGRGSRILRTDQSGLIRFRTDGWRWEVTQAAGAGR